jgi:hypothetical protein
MKLIVFKRFFAVCFVLTGVLYANACIAKPKVYVKLLEAYTQRTVAGIEGGGSATNYRFVVIWQGSKYPETFFWRGDGGFMPCNIEKVRKITKRTVGVPQGIDYQVVDGMGDELKKGDTLMLTPMKGGKFPVPAAIPKKAKNTLFFKTGSSGWLSFPVKKITVKQPIMAP